MSLNILVETRVNSKTIFEKSNPSLSAGEIAITDDLTDVRIGDGETKWNDLYPIELPQQVIEKWYNIATGTTNSHLITLPDMNYAYTTINAETGSMIEDIIKASFEGKNYFALEESLLNETIYSEKIGQLKFFSDNDSVFDIIFSDNSDQQKIDGISDIKFVSKIRNKDRSFLLIDKKGRELIEGLNTALESTNNFLNVLNDQINDPLTEIPEKIGKYLKPFGSKENGGMGLVNRPEESQISSGNYYLNANGNWVELLLSGDRIPFKAGEEATIENVVTNLIENQNKISTQQNNTIEQLYVLGTGEAGNITTLYYHTGVYIDAKTGVLIGAAYNDYAEARKTEPIAAGRVVVENGDDTLSISTERLMLGGNIVSDTYGMLIGETDDAKTPIALCGRVLAYPNEDRSEYYAGAPVCTGPNGTVSIMSKDEVLHYPECIIGYVSAVPTYEEWNGKKVNRRIWIKVV